MYRAGMARACGERLSFFSRATRAYSALRTVSSAVLQKMYENEAHVQCHVGHFDWISVLSLAILIEFCGNHGKVFSHIYHINNIRVHLNSFMVFVSDLIRSNGLFYVYCFAVFS